MTQWQYQAPDTSTSLQDRYRRQFESARDGILIFDAATSKILEVNPYLVEWFRYEREEWLSETLTSMKVWEDDPTAKTVFAELIRTGYVQVDGMPSRAKDGEVYQAGIVGNFYVEGERRVGQLNIRDVTARKRAEAALRDSEERFRLFSDSVQDYALILLDAEGRVEGWNSGAQRLLGYDSDEIVGEPSSRFFVPEDVLQGEHQKELSVALRDGRAEDERWHLRKDNSRFWGSGVIQPVRDETGRLRGFSKVMRDRTEQKLAEEALARQADELVRSNADLQHFAYVSSHDLQEPLRTITSFAQMLAHRKEDQLDTDARDYVGYILAGAQRMTALIRDLLAYSSVVNADTIPTAPVALDSAVNWAQMNLQLAIDDSNAVITCDQLPVVKGNQVQLLQLFQNLIGNAIKYRKPGERPLIRVTAEERENEWIISVMDNGQGIAPEYHERIFGVFKRLHGREVPGTGIGLALCKRIVERHKGRLWVESLAGEGAAFRFTLPHPPA